MDEAMKIVGGAGDAKYNGRWEILDRPVPPLRLKR